MTYSPMDSLINGEPIQRSESRAHPAILGYENLTFRQRVALIEDCGYGEHRDLDQLHAHSAFYNPLRHYQQEYNSCIDPVRLATNPLDLIHYVSDATKSSELDQMPAPGIRVMKKRATYQYRTLPKEVTAQKSHNGTKTFTPPLRSSTIAVQHRNRAQISRQVSTSTSLLGSRKTLSRSHSDRIHNKDTAQVTSPNAHPRTIGISARVQNVPAVLPDISLPQGSNSRSDLILNTITTYSQVAAAQATDIPEPYRDKAEEKKSPLTPHFLITPSPSPAHKRGRINESFAESPVKRTQRPKRR